MPYIPKEHEQYPVLPHCRARGGEVFQYISWPEEKFEALVGEHLLPYGYDSYDSYFAKIDALIQQHSDEPETVRLLERCKQNIRIWNKKEEWSICKYLGEDTEDIPGLGLHCGGYYYWPSMQEDPKYCGVIDDEEFTTYIYPTDAELWEIIVDPTGMARRTIYGDENSMSSKEYALVKEQIEHLKLEDLKQVQVLGAVDRLNECNRIKVRSIENRDPELIIPFKIYNATDLGNRKYLIQDETGKLNIYSSEQFEVLTEDSIRALRKTPRYQAHKCPACEKSEFPMRDSHQVCRVCGWVDVTDEGYHVFSAEEHGRLYREGKLRFQEWRDVMPRGNYCFRRDLMDGYLVLIIVDEQDMSAFSMDYSKREFVLDGTAWEAIDRLGGNLWLSREALEDYYCRTFERKPYVFIPTSFKEDGADRERITSKTKVSETAIFGSYMHYSEEEELAQIYFTEDKIPVNISIEEGADLNLHAGEHCEVSLWSNDYEVQFFKSDDAYLTADTKMAPVSMIPIGTFPADSSHNNFKQNAMILFTGYIISAVRNPSPQEGEPIWQLHIKTHGFSFDLYCFEEEPIEPGFLVHGRAWLYGSLHKKRDI